MSDVASQMTHSTAFSTTTARIVTSYATPLSLQTICRILVSNFD